MRERSSYLLQDKRDVRLLPTENPAVMAQAVHRTPTGSNLTEKLSRNSQAKAIHLDRAAILPQWEDLLIKAATDAKSLSSRYD
jgi:hypothetical protein